MDQLAQQTGDAFREVKGWADSITGVVNDLRTDMTSMKTTLESILRQMTLHAAQPPPARPPHNTHLHRDDNTPSHSAHEDHGQHFAYTTGFGFGRTHTRAFGRWREHAADEDLNYEESQLPPSVKLEKPPTFGGKVERDAEPWLMMVERYMHLAKFRTDADRINFTGSLLTDYALNWFHANIAGRRPGTLKINEWEAFREMMFKYFVDVNKVVRARAALDNARRRPWESVRSYTSYVRDLFFQIGSDNISESEKLDRYCAGINDKDIYAKLLKYQRLHRTGKPTFEEAAVIAEEMYIARKTAERGMREYRYRGNSRRDDEHRLKEERRNRGGTAASRWRRTLNHLSQHRWSWESLA